MKHGVLFAIVLVCADARADAHSWSGRSEWLDVSVMTEGFDEGAGEGGWSESDARDFAAWAARFDAVIPKGASVKIARDLDDATTVTMDWAGRHYEAEMPGGPDLDDALLLVSCWTGRAAPPAPAHPTLYTVQLLAARSEANASTFAARLEARGVDAPDSFFDERCHPCSIPAARVETSADGLHRVIVGVYDEHAAAARARATLQREFRLRGWVRAF